ncbi:putative inositol oxygenase [Hibiscus syriacus]|uniref:Inositol oxygenase n=1 Tax=Hibiscus syriacus TaxID=106335 RepID=A0A6A3CJW1_HIBSY|nr:putative inositol oxygenase [Hibiscus syriacus]
MAIELVSNHEFALPEKNAFGNSFRDYKADDDRKDILEQHYKSSHINQTYGFLRKNIRSWTRLIWECCELLNEVVDDSDPDLDEPQIQHLLQSAEAIRKDYPNEDWLHLTALIHDLGKVLVLPQFGGLPQWAVVGDTFPVGRAFDESNVHHKENPDFNNPKYNTKNGIYSEGCELDNVLMSWGHDDYKHMVAKENGTTLPSAGLFIIRYHSFYTLHKYGAYFQFMNEEDKENMKWLKVFNKYDLYSKSKVLVDVEEVKPYYESLIAKYFPAKLKW